VIRFGVIGYGYWGPNLVRNIAESPGAKIAAVSDLHPQRLTLAQTRYPGITVSTDHQDLFRNPAIDAIAISTPVSTHFDLALQALRAGKHVLVEKPITASSEEALRLMEEADKRKLLLMVDHTFVYTGAVRKMRELIDNGSLGDIYYYDSVRVNLGLFQQDVNVIWDLAVHDLAIMDYLLPERPCAVSATGISHIAGRHENIAYITMFFAKSMIAHIHVNWLSPVKVRSTLLSGSQKMIVYDDMEITEKVKVYDRGISLKSVPEAEKLYSVLVGYRTGDMWSPRLDTSEALALEIQHFAQCIETGTAPLTSAGSGLQVVRILEAATESMQDRGRLVELNVEKKATV
jgi:predicted dehydrogenase